MTPAVRWQLTTQVLFTFVVSRTRGASSSKQRMPNPKAKVVVLIKHWPLSASCMQWRHCCRDSSSEERYANRQTDSAEILSEFKQWLDDTQQKVAPKNTLGKAVNYTLKYWSELSRYIKSGDWPIDNNPAENAIRPFVVGRKAWLFSNSQRGATASANLYSLIETAKANNREPYQYLSWMLNKLPSTPAESVEDLMPWNMPDLPNE